jgi:hypothetical protein
MQALIDFLAELSKHTSGHMAWWLLGGLATGPTIWAF